jgi:hypothetical protein
MKLNGNIYKKNITWIINNLDAIATRNPQDFPVQVPQILTPSQLIQSVIA